ncbi:MAG TPA: DUF1932 domain-containing protein [Xanthobacteraceae bacterium]|nr:DUF1932 domain-containing protein [Xanthobacteraceae bacterium]
MKPTVAIIAQGAMGAGVARRLHDNGLRVLTSLAGRSGASAARAAAAGMEDAPDSAIAGSDMILSIVPPSDAVALAERLAPALRAAPRKPLYVDCNAISPRTVPQVAAPVAAAGCAFVDAGIIGQPPADGYAGPVIYASGPEAGRLAVLRERGLDIRVLEGPLHAASALKMSYAGITKGMTAIATAMILAADEAGAADALRAELQSSFGPYPWANRQVNGMFGRAYRWVGEMEEIADFTGDNPATRDIYLAISHLYQQMAEDVAGTGEAAARLRAFFGTSK